MGVVGPGVPGWVDVESSDFDRAKAFYLGLFGWEPAGPDDGYVMFTLNGQAVAGGSALSSPDRASVWSTYVIVADAGDTAAKATAAGGEVLTAPVTIGDQGAMAMFRDPSGAEICVWQPGTMFGGEVFNEPGSLTWNELVTADPAAAKPFYRAVFGWETEGDDGTRWLLDGAEIASMTPAVTDRPPHWAVTFSVASCLETAALAASLGGTVLEPPTEMPLGGRSARLQDPTGAQFLVSSFDD